MLKCNPKYPTILVASILPLALSSCNLRTNTPSTRIVAVQPEMVAPSGQFLYAVFMLSPTEGWAVGGTFDDEGTPKNGTLLRYSGGKWTTIPVSTPLFGMF